jgi:hypothetical protein
VSNPISDRLRQHSAELQSVSDALQQSISERLRQHAAELVAIAAVLDDVYSERDEYKRRCEVLVEWALKNPDDEFHTAIG